MGKRVIGINQMVCVGVLIPMKKLGLEKKENSRMPEMNRDKINEIIEKSKIYGGVGATPIGFEYFAILIDSEKFKEKGKAFFDWCDSQGLEPKIADKTCIVDKRYTEGGIFEGFTVEIPPQYIDEAVRNFILKYCDEVKVNQDVDKSLLIYEGELYPNKNIVIMYNSCFFGGGLSNDAVYASHSATTDYKRILESVKKVVEKWIKNHKGIYNN